MTRPTSPFAAVHRMLAREDELRARVATSEAVRATAWPRQVEAPLGVYDRLVPPGYGDPRRPARPRVLYLAFFFPPSRGSGASAHGRRPTTWPTRAGTSPCTRPRASSSRTTSTRSTPSLEADPLPPPPAGGAAQHGIRPLGALISGGSTGSGWTFPSLDATLRRKRRDLSFPEPYSSWIPSVLRHALAEHARHPYDVVVATGNPFALLRRRVDAAPRAADPVRPGLPRRLDLQPVQRGGPLPRGATARGRGRTACCALRGGGVRQRRDAQPERRPVPGRRGPDDGGAQRVGARDPRRGRSPGDRRRPRCASATSARSPRRCRSSRCSTPGAWRASSPSWRDARLDLLRAPRLLPLTSARRCSPASPPRRASASATTARSRRPRCPRCTNDLDALLLWLPGGRYVTSGKVFEYMATAKPVVSVHLPELAAVEVLRDYPLWASCGLCSSRADLAGALVARRPGCARPHPRAGRRRRPRTRCCYTRLRGALLRSSAACAGSPVL